MAPFLMGQEREGRLYPWAARIHLAGSALFWAEIEWPGRPQSGMCWFATREGVRHEPASPTSHLGCHFTLA